MFISALWGATDLKICIYGNLRVTSWDFSPWCMWRTPTPFPRVNPKITFWSITRDCGALGVFWDQTWILRQKLRHINTFSTIYRICVMSYRSFQKSDLPPAPLSIVQHRKLLSTLHFRQLPPFRRKSILNQYWEGDLCRICCRSTICDEFVDVHAAN